MCYRLFSLVFTQLTENLDLIERSLADISTEQRTWEKDLNYGVITGATTALERSATVNAINEKSTRRFGLCLISTKAGSQGTNKVGANRVIIFDASWNPR